MSISIHIPFYNPIPDKKEGYRQLTRYDYLKENVESLKKLSLNNDIFIHIRLGDTIQWKIETNNYIVNTIKLLNYDNIYIANDTLKHKHIINIQNTFKNAHLIDYKYSKRQSWIYGQFYIWH